MEMRGEGGLLSGEQRCAIDPTGKSVQSLEGHHMKKGNSETSRNI